MIKIKKKLSFHIHVYFDAVCAEALYLALLYLKEIDSRYCNISVNLNSVPNNLKDLSELDDNLSDIDN